MSYDYCNEFKMEKNTKTEKKVKIFKLQNIIIDNKNNKENNIKSIK